MRATRIDARRDAAIDLRLADAERQRAAAQIGAEGRGGGEVWSAPTVSRAAERLHCRRIGWSRARSRSNSLPACESAVSRRPGEAEGRDAKGAAVEGVGGERGLQRTARPSLDVGHHALGGTPPSSSTSTLVSASEGAARHWRAGLQREAAEPAVAAGEGGLDPVAAQRVAQELAESAVKRAFHHQRWRGLGHRAVERDFQGLAGSRAFRPERSPDKAARKSLAEIEPSTRWPRQSNCPVAAKEREIEGQASDRSMSSSSFSSARLPASL